MHTMIRRAVPLAAVAAATLPWMSAGTASAAGSTTLTANLRALNGSGAHSTVLATLTGDSLHITIHSAGLADGAPHAQHIHLGGTHSCPGANQKGTGIDGHLRVADAVDEYGGIAVSLTTSGDTGPRSGLAVDRYPVGNASYQRTITLTAAVADQVRIGRAVIVQHGVDYNHDGRYDGTSKSELNPKLPEEATDPAACGVLQVSQMSAMPTGGVQTGGGSTSGVQYTGVLLAGASAMAVGAATMLLTRRHGNGSGR